MKTVVIKWQRLLSKGKTCPRCGSTEKEIEMAISKLEQSLPQLGFNVVLEKSEISEEKFKNNPSLSNTILINDKPIEDYLSGKSGQSKCCEVCGESECRTVEVDNKIYETIPHQLIIQAALIAATQLME